MHHAHSHQQSLVHEVLGLSASGCVVLDLLAQDVPDRDVHQVVLCACVEQSCDAVEWQMGDSMCDG